MAPAGCLIRLLFAHPVGLCIQLADDLPDGDDGMDHGAD
jgi:hypothetical protein